MANTKKFLDQAGVSTLWSRIAEEVAKEKTRAEAAEKAAKDAADAAQADVDALEAKVGTIPENKTVVQMISEAQTAATYDDTEVRGLISDNADAIKAHKEAIDAKVTTLIGEDDSKSVRTISAEEVAKVVAGADASFDTLKEIADWISSHKTDAATMNSAIVKLEGILAGIGGDGEKATVVAYVTDAISALKIGDYAKAADLTALAARVEVLEGKSHEHANKALLDTYTQTEANLADAVAKKHEHTNKEELDKIAVGDKAKWDNAAGEAHEHANKTVLDGISAEKVAAWDVAEQNAKSYADGLAKNYDAAGAAAQALTDAKAYTDSEINSKVIALTTEEIDAAIASVTTA